MNTNKINNKINIFSSRLLSKLLVFILIGISISTIAQPMNGTYTVNSGQATGGTNFISLTAFATAINSRGVNGAVTVNMSAGPYVGRVVFNQITGASATNTITINGNGTTIEFNATSTDHATLRFNGTDWFRVKDLNIRTLHATNGVGIHFYNHADNNIIEGCTITCPSNNSTGSNSAGIAFSNSTTTTTTNGPCGSNNLIKNNLIQGNAAGGFYYGITVRGTSTSDRESDNIIIGNTIRNIYLYGIYSYYVDNLDISNNIIERPNRTQFTTYGAIYIYYTGNANIDGNIIRKSYGNNVDQVGTFYGVFCMYNNNGTFNNITNNLMYDNSMQGSVYGVYTGYTGSTSIKTRISHNTIHHTSVNTVNTTSNYTWRGIYHYESDASQGDVEILNNVFDFRSNRTYNNLHAWYLQGKNFVINNNIYNFAVSFPTVNHGYINTSNSQGTLSTMQMAITLGYDGRSLIAQPLYNNLAGGDLSLVGSHAKRGTPAGISSDIYANPRSGCTPDIGAIESEYASDLSAASLGSNSICEYEEVAVSGTIKNGGSLAFDCPYISYSINDGSIVTEPLSSTVNSGGTLNFNFAKKIMLEKAGNYTVKVFLSTDVSNAIVLPLTVRSAPKDFAIKEGNPFGGKLFEGTMEYPDAIASPEQANYEFTNPSGHTNAQYGTTWRLNSISMKDLDGVAVLSSDTNYTTPIGINNSKFAFKPSASATDKIYEIVVTMWNVTTSCPSLPVSRFVAVAPRPIAAFKNNTACGGEITKFENTSNITSGWTTYEWDFGDGTVSDYVNPTHKYASNGMYNVKLKAISNLGFMDSAVINVGVHDVPTATFTYNNTCKGDTAYFTASANSPNNGSITYNWDFSDGNVSSGIQTNHVFANQGVFPVTLTITDGVGCVVNVKKSLSNTDIPDANFNINTNAVCIGSPIKFTNTSNNGGSTGYEWDFGDNNFLSGKNADHTYAVPGDYTAKLLARNILGCEKVHSVNISVLDNVKIAFTTDKNCSKETIQFTNTSTLPTGESAAYTWNFGDGVSDINENPSHTYGATGEYTVTVNAIASNGCNSVLKSKISINEKPIVYFTTDKLTACTGDEISFVNSSYSVDQNITYNWDFDNTTSSSSKHSSVTYTDAGTYDVILEATIGGTCSETYTRTIEINEIPDAGFDVASSQLGDGVLIFSLNTPNGQGNYKWDMGEGTVRDDKNNFEFRYPPVGVFNICLTRENNGCSAKECKQFTMNTASINDLNRTFNVYPNPSSGSFNIKSDVVDLVSIKVYNTLGEMVYTKNEVSLINSYQINLENSPAGIYMVEVNSIAGTSVQKVTIVK